MQIVGQASDGPEAVQEAKELQPDLIALNHGLLVSPGEFEAVIMMEDAIEAMVESQ